ncbi:hypothetical protein MtrunA17_Chr6g0461521 [Medicago truncatula]|uniref:Transmembrane protein n=1 Tax=Medicago truncatula TaxID=3880 RepID=A0A396HHP1_MEDTR|nr:hypothetical protein MtrunA17_Chr6g0461521 [Medicago truncatula]
MWTSKLQILMICFLIAFYCFFCLFSVSFSFRFFEGFGLVPPPLVIIFPPFLINFLECGGIGWRSLEVPT